MAELKSDSNIKHRLENIKYQFIKSVTYDFTDIEKLKKVQSLYDAAIDSDTEALDGASLPTTAMGIELEWGEDGTEFTATSNGYEIVNDSLIDDVVLDQFDDQQDENVVMASGDTLLYMDENDTAAVYYETGTGAMYTDDNYNEFSGYFVSKS